MLQLSDWLPTLSLIFGGCCSNALTLEQLTTRYPHSGTLITFFQFLVISIYGLPRHATFTTKYLIPLPYLKPRRIPLTRYLLQVVLFYALSLLNNIAFSYDIPMPVHIIFRSGGLMISMIMGRFVLGRKYTAMQVISVFMITLGVIFSSSSASNTSAAHVSSMGRYMTGILFLTIALILSGFLGVVQDRTYSHFRTQDGSPWQESMFYLHFLSLPMFIFVWGSIATQLRTLQASPPIFWNRSSPYISVVPTSHVILALNVLTQLICAAGANRLTSHASSLTVTLVLVVRKAASLIISVMLFANHDGDQTEQLLLWGGATLVFTGTIMYSLSKRQFDSKKTE